MKIFLTAISLLLLASCKGDIFPSDHIINMDQRTKVCDRYHLNTDTMTMNFEYAIPFEACPNTYGFEQSDIGKVSAWLRRNKKKLDECAAKLEPMNSEIE